MICDLQILKTFLFQTSSLWVVYFCIELFTPCDTMWLVIIRHFLNTICLVPVSNLINISWFKW